MKTLLTLSPTGPVAGESRAKGDGRVKGRQHMRQSEQFASPPHRPPVQRGTVYISKSGTVSDDSVQYNGGCLPQVSRTFSFHFLK